MPRLLIECWRLVERFRPVDQRDRDALLALYQRHLDEVAALVASINARPILAERIDARHLDKPWSQYAVYEPQSPKSRIGYRGSNGSARKD